jgi:hypothetical protein
MSPNDHVRAAEALSPDATAPRRRRQRFSTGVRSTIKYVRRTSSGAASNGCVAAGSGLSTCLSTTIKYARRTTNGAAGNGLGITMNYLRRTRIGAANNGLDTTIKYL